MLAFIWANRIFDSLLEFPVARLAKRMRVETSIVMILLSVEI
jgi:hypothetical protein